MKNYNDKEKIIEHYDFLSPYYHALWGKHLHHGYWVTGDESKEDAQLALTKHLTEVAKIKSRSNILDVGCGFGASSIYLAKNFDAKTTGITISSVQVQMAEEAAKRENVSSKFILMDAERLAFSESFDVIWSVESISHYENKEKFFEKACGLLKPGGTIALIDWFKKEDLSQETSKKYITPIEKGMLVELRTVSDYISILQSNGMVVRKSENLNKHTYKTWDISIEIIQNKSFWQLALKHGKEFVNFLKSFKAMKDGFASGNFVYGLIVAEKLADPEISI